MNNPQEVEHTLSVLDRNQRNFQFEDLSDLEISLLIRAANTERNFFPTNAGGVDLIGVDLIGGGGVSLSETANDGSLGGNSRLLCGTGGASTDGFGGDGGQARLIGGAGGSSSTGKGGRGGFAGLQGGRGGDSTDDDGGDAEDVDLTGGIGGDGNGLTGTGGNGGNIVLAGGNGGGGSVTGSGGSISLTPGDMGTANEGSVSLFQAAGLASLARPSIATQAVSVDVAAFNALRDALIALGVIVDGD